MEVVNAIDRSQFGKICRICLQYLSPPADKNKLISSLKFNGIEMSVLLDSCASVRVEENDGLPQHLCSPCQQQIINVHLFRTMCSENQYLLSIANADVNVIKQELTEEVIVKQEEDESTVNDLNDTDQEEVEKKNCGLGVTGDEAKHLQLHTPDESAEAQPNQAMSSREERLKARKVIRMKNKQHKCSECNRIFKTTKDLNRHLYVHTEEKPYSCTKCEKTFKTSVAAKRHMKTHTNDKSHSCNLCGKVFHNRWLLNRHLQSHTGEKPYQCKRCKSRFTRKENLKNHIRRFHP